MNCLKCTNQVEERGRRVHFICAKVALTELLNLRTVEVVRNKWSERIANVRDYPRLEIVAMLLGKDLLDHGLGPQVWEPFSRWFTCCIGTMPDQDRFRDYQERGGDPDRQPPAFVRRPAPSGGARPDAR